jgi:hypothetical protein
MILNDYQCYRQHRLPQMQNMALRSTAVRRWESVCMLIASPNDLTVRTIEDDGG